MFSGDEPLDPMFPYPPPLTTRKWAPDGLVKFPWDFDTDSHVGVTELKLSENLKKASSNTKIMPLPLSKPLGT